MSKLVLNGLTPVQCIVNNGALKSVNAMPQKDSTSDGTSSFELGRSIYVNSFPKAGDIQTKQNNQKKWQGNRDASQIIANRRNTSIGRGSINTTVQTPLSFTTYKDVNVVQSALNRCRSGGCVVPTKKLYSNIGLVTNYKQPVLNQAMPAFVDARTGNTITNYIQPINKSKTFLSL